MKFEIKPEESFVPCVEKVGSGIADEEYQAYGDFRNGKFEKEEKDALSIWIGKTGKQYYLGIAGRQADLLGQDYHYFRTIGFQEISKKDYEAFKKVPSFSKTR